MGHRSLCDRLSKRAHRVYLRVTIALVFSCQVLCPYFRILLCSFNGGALACAMGPWDNDDWSPAIGGEAVAMLAMTSPTILAQKPCGGPPYWLSKLPIVPFLSASDR